MASDAAAALPERLQWTLSAGAGAARFDPPPDRAAIRGLVDGLVGELPWEAPWRGVHGHLLDGPFLPERDLGLLLRKSGGRDAR